MKKSKIKLEVLKYNALKARKNYQLPYKLVHYINQLDNSSDIHWINYLLGMCEQLMRIKGFYKKYPIAEQDANQQLESDYLNYIRGS